MIYIQFSGHVPERIYGIYVIKCLTVWNHRKRTIGSRFQRWMWLVDELTALGVLTIECEAEGLVNVLEQIRSSLEPNDVWHLEKLRENYDIQALTPTRDNLDRFSQEK